jgi:hypothetical protein
MVSGSRLGNIASLEREEKWLLLSATLRSQPNLMRYIKESDKN